MKYPAGNGKELFDSLEKRAEKEQYDDEFLLQLIAYQKLYPHTEHFDLFFGRYAAFHGNYGLALEHAQKAYKKRMVNYEVWKLLVKCYLALGKPEKALPFQGYCCKFYTKRLDVTMPPEALQKHLGELSVAMGRGNYAPFCESKMSFSSGKLGDRQSLFGGEYIPVPEDREGYAYWVGVYNELSRRSGHGTLLQREIEGAGGFDLASTDFVFDIQRSKIMRELTVEPEGCPLVVPVAATAENQKVDFSSNGLADGDAHDMTLGQWEYTFFRIDQDTRLSSSTKQPLVFGKPVPLRHHARRKRFVLNILLDALCWNEIRRQDYQNIPRLMDFFSKGIIFNQHFSVAEYTYPSLPTIETGMYPHHSQIFNERAAIQMDTDFVTLSERMRELGYYCVSLMGSGDAIYNGATRGYDRLLVNAYDLSAYAGVERVIRQLEAFAECDQFLSLHLMETHPWPVDKFPVGVGAQVRLPLPDSLNRERKEVASVYLPDTKLYHYSNRQAMAHVDRNLAALFDYILGHYDEDEYIIQLYSDHGAPIYDKNPGILSDGQTGAAWMLRGGGVPSLGVVEELTSAVDIYPALAKLAGFPVGKWVDGNLPAALGGRERECVYSNSLFPGQTYKLCIRTKTHACYLESTEPVDEDGTVDLSGAELTVRARDGSEKPVEDPRLEQKFLRWAQDFTAPFHHGGRQWRSMREARSEWFPTEAL